MEEAFIDTLTQEDIHGSLQKLLKGVTGVRKSIHQSWLAKGLGLLYWGFKGVQEEIPSEEVSIAAGGDYFEGD